MVFVMAHGGKGVVYGTDGKELSIDAITEVICSKIDKWIPKVVNIQLHCVITVDAKVECK